MGENSDGIGRDGVTNKNGAAALSAALVAGTDLRLFSDIYILNKTMSLDGGIPTVGLPGFDAAKVLVVELTFQILLVI